MSLRQGALFMWLVCCKYENCVIIFLKLIYLRLIIILYVLKVLGLLNLEGIK